MSRWEDKNGDPVDRSDALSRKWLENHFWNWDKEKFNKLLSSNKTVFIGGSASNQAEFFAFFDKIFLIKIDDATLRSRISTRNTNDFGKHPEELAHILSWHESMQDYIENKGAVVIDGSQPLNTVVDQILSNVNGN